MQTWQKLPIKCLFRSIWQKFQTDIILRSVSQKNMKLSPDTAIDSTFQKMY